MPEFEEAEDELRREMDGDWDEKFKIAEEAEKKAEDRCEIMTKRLEAIVRNMEQKLVAHEVELQHLVRAYREILVNCSSICSSTMQLRFLQ